MTNGYLTFLDYLEVRRRVERRLASGKWLLLHTIAFGVGAAYIGYCGLMGWPLYWTRNDVPLIDSSYGFIVACWSSLLLVHGLWTYWRSGAHGGKRDEVIEGEMHKHVQADDLYLSHHPRDLFRLHGLLNDDIRTRASIIPVLLVFISINALIWIPWDILQPGSPFAWRASPLLIIPLLLALAWNIWWRGRHNSQIREQLESLFSNQPIEADYDPEREVHLSDDGELVTVDEYMMKRKRN